jgi:hypothetical protein
MHHTENELGNPCKNKASRSCSVLSTFYSKDKQGVHTCDAFQRVYTLQDLRGESQFRIELEGPKRTFR